jgi:hypothetical protein
MLIQGSARSDDGAVRVTVGTGGALRELEIRQSALAMGGRELAATVLRLTDLATAEAVSRARNLLRAKLSGLPVDALAALGCTQDDELAEQVESTVPTTWRDL